MLGQKNKAYDFGGGGESGPLDHGAILYKKYKMLLKFFNIN